MPSTRSIRQSISASPSSGTTVKRTVLSTIPKPTWRDHAQMHRPLHCDLTSRLSYEMFVSSKPVAQQLFGAKGRGLRHFRDAVGVGARMDVDRRVGGGSV